MQQAQSNPMISTSQLFCLLMLARISAEIIFPSAGEASVAEAVIVLIISEIIRFLLALPIIIYSFRGRDFYTAIYRKHRFLGWVSALGAALLLWGAAVRTLFFTGGFARRNLLNDASFVMLMIIAAAFALYLAFSGVEAIARSGAVFLAIAVLITAAVLVGTIPYMQLNQAAPSRFDGIVSAVIERTIRGGEFLVFAALLPFCAQGKRFSCGRCVMLFWLFSFLAALVLYGLYFLTLKSFFGLTEYPLVAAASLSDVVIFKRIDGFAAAVWGIAAAFRCGLMLFGGWSVLRSLFKAHRDRQNVPKEGKT